jgi:type IV pilus assembly protein PilM
MLAFVQNMLSPRANPIGITFGADRLRVAQVMEAKGEVQILAAASRDVPAEVRDDRKKRLDFFSESLRELLSRGGFRGRQVVLGLPSQSLAMVHLRLPPMDDGMIRKAVAYESMGKLPFHPSQAMIRHIIAGEVYDKQEPKLETILMASPKAAVEDYLSAAARAKLDVVGLDVEPLALVECFARLGRRKEDTQAVTAYLDIGASGTRVLIALGRKVLFARSISVGGDDFNKAYAKDQGIQFAEARGTRQKLTAEENASLPDENDEDSSSETAPLSGGENSFAFPGSAGGAAVVEAPTAPPTASQLEMNKIFSAIRQPLDRLVSEVEMCRRYHDATFAAMPVQRIVFAGGEAKQRSLCTAIAKRLGLPASVWDPVARLPKDIEHAMELGLDPKNRLPDWAVVVGLSLGVKE